MKQKQVKESRRKNKNKEKPLVQSYPQSDTIYLQTAQALGPCTPSDATAPHKRKREQHREETC